MRSALLRRRAARTTALAIGIPALVVGVLAPIAAAHSHSGNERSEAGPAIDHIVVIYQENHSFDNLYGSWEGVDGLGGDPAAVPNHVQTAPDGTPLPCLPQLDVNLTSPPLPVTCSGSVGSTPIKSAFGNTLFSINDYIAPDATTCPQPGQFAPNGIPAGQGQPGGCTRDLVHRFYNEQYQINGGQMDHYAAGSDAAGQTMGYVDTRSTPIYRYLHSAGAPHYAIADRFFQGAFGGSFLNHQWLIAARTPQWPGAVRDGSTNDLHSVVGSDGLPTGTPLHPKQAGVKDAALTQAANPDGSCAVPTGAPTPPAGTVCGDYAVNTVQPPYQPYPPGTPPARRLPPLTTPTIGDRLSDAGVDWAWYSGGWDNAAGNVNGPGWTNDSTPGVCGDPRTMKGAVWPNCPDATFQFHHQPFNYYARYAPGTADRAAHLRDETEFIAAAKAGGLKPVSFVKPVGEENEHPGYASVANGNQHLVDLIKAVMAGPDASRTLIVATYDEFGGSWDHVPPPTDDGVSDKWGPGTRVPALVVWPGLSRPFSVDHAEHDTTAILAVIEKRFGLAPLGTRDAAATPWLNRTAE